MGTARPQPLDQPVPELERRERDRSEVAEILDRNDIEVSAQRDGGLPSATHQGDQVGPPVRIVRDRQDDEVVRVQGEVGHLAQQRREPEGKHRLVGGPGDARPSGETERIVSCPLGQGWRD